MFEARIMKLAPNTIRSKISALGFRNALGGLGDLADGGSRCEEGSESSTRGSIVKREIPFSIALLLVEEKHSFRATQPNSGIREELLRA